MSLKEVGFAVSTVWVILAAILVIFMQAGFAFLEAGLTRMKNVGHIAAKNVLILAIASVVYYCVGFGMAFGDGGNGIVGGSGFFPSVDELLTIGESPFSWFSAIPGAAGYLFEVAFAAVSLAIVWGAMAERTKLWVYFAFGACLHAHLLARLALDLEPAGLAVRAGHAGLRRLDGRPLPGRPGRPRGRDPARPADRQVRLRPQAERDPRPQHGVHDPRRDHPLVRLVRVQPGLDALGRLRRRRVLRLRRPEHQPRRGCRRARCRHHVVDRGQEARPLDDAQRCDRRARGDHRRLRVRRPVGGDPDRVRLGHHRRRRLAARRAGRARRSRRRDRSARHVGRLGHAVARLPGRAEAGEQPGDRDGRPLLRRRLPPARDPGPRSRSRSVRSRSPSRS